MRADFFGVQKADVMPVAREKYKGVLVGNMGYSADEAEAAIAEGKLDAVAFGTAFLANPDLPARIRAKAPPLPTLINCNSPSAGACQQRPLNAGARTVPGQSTSGCLARSSTGCATSRPTKTSAWCHRLPSSESTPSCPGSQWPPGDSDSGMAITP